LCDEEGILTALPDDVSISCVACPLALPPLHPPSSYFELEQAEYAAKGINLSVEAWLVKLMVRLLWGNITREGGGKREASIKSHRLCR